MSSRMKQGDTLPDFERTLMVGNEPADLTGATVQLILRKKGFPTPAISRQIEIVGAPTAGGVRHIWETGSTDTLEGEHIIEVVARWPGGRVLTFPNDNKGETLTFIKGGD